MKICLNSNIGTQYPILQLLGESTDSVVSLNLTENNSASIIAG